jgi:hypothetical protein
MKAPGRVAEPATQRGLGAGSLREPAKYWYNAVNSRANAEFLLPPLEVFTAPDDLNWMKSPPPQLSAAVNELARSLVAYLMGIISFPLPSFPPISTSVFEDSLLPSLGLNINENTPEQHAMYILV